MSTRNVLTFAERLEIHRHLETVIRRHPDGVEYIGEESDQTVAAKFNCTARNVQYIRGQIFGQLRPPPAPVSIDVLSRRIGALESRISTLEKIFDRLEPDWRQHNLALEDPANG